MILATDHHAHQQVFKQFAVQSATGLRYYYQTFYSCFYPECKVSNITVIGKAETVNFKTTGKEI